MMSHTEKIAKQDDREVELLDKASSSLRPTYVPADKTSATVKSEKSEKRKEKRERNKTIASSVSV